MISRAHFSALRSGLKSVSLFKLITSERIMVSWKCIFPKFDSKTVDFWAKNGYFYRNLSETPKLCQQFWSKLLTSCTFLLLIWWTYQSNWLGILKDTFSSKIHAKIRILALNATIFVSYNSNNSFNESNEQEKRNSSIQAHQVRITKSTWLSVCFGTNSLHTQIICWVKSYTLKLTE